MNEHQQQRAEWLASLKPGDEVAVSAGSVYGGPSIEKIERTTATQIVLMGRRRKYRRSDGRLVGQSFGPKVEPVTDEIRGLVLRFELSQWLADLTEYGRAKKSVSTAQLVAMKAAFDAAGEQACSN